MSLEKVIPKCPKCGGTLIEKEKEGKKYYACPNWLPDGKGCEGFFWSPDQKKKKSYGGSLDKEILAELIEIKKLISIAVKEKLENEQ